MLWKLQFNKSDDEPGGSTTTDELKKRLQSTLGENDKVNTPYQARYIDFNTPLKTSSAYLDGKQRTPDFDHSLLEDADDEELTDKGAATDPGYVRKRWSIFFSIVCALLFAAVVGYALISFVFPPLWLLNLTVITAYLVLDGVAAIAAAAIGYYIFNQLYAAYSLNRTKTKVMALLAIIIAAVLFTVISVASGGLFPLLSSIVLGAGLLFATLSTFVLGLSLWSIMKFGKSKVDGEADDSIQSISFYPTNIVDFDSDGQNKFLPDDNLTDGADLTKGESWHVSHGETIKKYLTLNYSPGASVPAKVTDYFTPARDDKIEKREFNDGKYDEFIRLFEDKIYLVEKNGSDQKFVHFLQERLLLLKTPQYEVLFRQEMTSFNESKYAEFIQKCTDDMSKAAFASHQQWFDETIAVFANKDYFTSEYNEFINKWDKISNQPCDLNSRPNGTNVRMNSMLTCCI
ncbi:MAG: hypothetical protein GY821_03910 [Gammaproteobacteria bacterium]|nr:hypothetical protein [Gammaproteobacteria bacterium]